MKYTLLMLILLLTLSCLSQGEVQEESVPDESVVEEPPVQEEEVIIETEPELDPEPIPEPEPITEPEAEADPVPEITITTYRVPPSSPHNPLDQIELPLPEYIISFYSYLPLGERGYNPHVDLAYPTYRKPIPPAAEPVRTKEKPDPPVKEETTPETVKEIREERYSSGIPIPLVLEGTDWVYLGEENSEDTGFQNRKVLTDRTLFTFSFPEARTYILLFSRQNHSTGDSEQEKIRVVIEADSDKGIQNEASPESLVPPEPAAETVQETRETQESLETLEAQARLQEIEENPEEAEESLELLEFLVNVESDDDTLAGYYYRMARVLEMNSKVQDLNKAYDTYEYIIDHFFLTDYYELSEERIRFLDRHFFKLR